jgi:hypothetical protein
MCDRAIRIANTYRRSRLPADDFCRRDIISAPVLAMLGKSDESLT